MPGIVVFRRRWSVGSDDLVLPGIFLFVLHSTWFVILSVVLFGLTYNPHETCSLNLVDHGRGYLGILLSCMIAEVAIIWLSMRGGILYTEPRDSMQYVLYVRLAILVIEFIYAIVGIVWLAQYYTSCNDVTAKNVTLGMVVCNWVVILSVCITVLCVFDPTGRTFVKLRATKRRQRNLRTYNLRHRLEEGQASSWTRRLKVFLCCTRTKDSQSDAYSEIAYLFAEFFRDLDIVPSDIIAGLVLLRQRQRAKRNAVLDEANNDILAFLSGMPVTRKTKYLDLKNTQEMQRYKEVCYYMLFALAAYGWPMYLIRKPTCGICRLAGACSSCCCLCSTRPRFAPGVTIEEDNCCGCNAIAIKRHFLDENMNMVDIVYTSCHDAVYETPFFVAVDHEKKKVVISIRGTLSPKDALTDLTGDAERLPVEGHHGTWLGHKGMVLSAEYIKKKLEQEMVLSQAFGRDLGRGTKHYGLIVVGHSLGAGTAAILSFLLRPQYPSLKCFAYSPPGGLLSEDAMEYSKEFVTSVVLGKDLVPRIGLSQLEGFRRHLLDVLQRSNKPKWRIILGGTRCIPKSELPDETEGITVPSNRLWTHPSDLTIALSASTPLYPPGRIIHVVHNHPAEQCCFWDQEEPTYFAIWGDNKAFEEVIISPAMLHEHLPHVVMEGLNKVLENYNKGKTALLSAAKVMVSPTEVDLNPELIFHQPPHLSPPILEVIPAIMPGTHANRRNSSTKRRSEMSSEKRRRLAAILLMASAELLKEESIRPAKRRRRVRSRQWLEQRGTVSHMSLLRELRENNPDDYRNYLRMSEESYQLLLSAVRPYIERKDTHMRLAIPVEDRLAVTLRFLATGRSLQDLHFTAAISVPALSSIIPETCAAIVRVLEREYLQCPRTAEAWKTKADDFERMWDFPNCGGALDGKHVRITQPHNSGSYFFNYKGYFSIILFALVDANYEFMFVDVGMNGRVSDGGVFDKTTFGHFLKTGKLCLPNNADTKGNLNFVFLGDDAFPLLPHLLKPFPQRDAGAEQRIFNYRVSRARRVVENAFGIMASRFRVLHTAINLQLKSIDKVVLACCMLHNFLRRNNSSTYAATVQTGGEPLSDGDIPIDWRVEAEHLASLRPAVVHRHADDAIKSRTDYCAFVNGPGAVPWQQAMV